MFLGFGLRLGSNNAALLGGGGGGSPPAEGTIDLEWDGNAENLIPLFSQFDIPDPQVGDVIKMRRSTTNTFASYDEAEDTITSLAPVNVLDFDFGGNWPLATRYAQVLQYRSAVLIDTSNIETVTITGDITAPTLSLPVDTAVSGTTGTGGFTTDEAGTGFVVVTPFAMAAPSAPQIVLGLGGDGNAAAYADSEAVASAGAFTFTADFTGLTPGTSYKAHFALQDAVPLNSNVVSGDGFNTPADFVPTYHILLH